MEYIIGGIVIVIVLFLTGYILKKKYYKEIDRLETWKMDIVNRPVLDEMSKVKQLNMTGQTEELFERWRTEWDDIVTAQLPNVEEYLFDAEEYIDKYRFRKAKEVQQTTEKFLNEIEENIKKLLNELNELVGSEEKNRSDIQELKDLYRESKKLLLAHHHTYGKTADILEQQLDETFAKFEVFDEKTENGNYLEAREIVLTIQAQLDEVKLKMERIPEFLVECQSKIPSQLKELSEGYKEMVEQGYILDHIEFDKEINRLENETSAYLSLIETADLTDVHKGIEEIKGSIDFLYELLEAEVHAKHYIGQQDDPTRNMLFTNKEINRQLKEEMELVRQSYHLSEKDMFIQAELEKKLIQLNKSYEVLEHKIISENTAHSLLKTELEGIKSQLEEIEEEHVKFAEKLQALRKDEMAARESIDDLRKNLAEAARLVSKSNIPGLPQDYLYLMEDAKESIGNVIMKLDEKPLNIQTIQQYLEVAVLTVEKIVNTTNDMIETVMLVEKVIQYGNRYRRRYPSVAKGLQDAEASFRGFDYKTALEQAATAIEEIDPSAMKKIEELISE
ncbi:septation ring formation regulator EzrA [Bacillus sp. DTU_2020_1000418_1_SI_GHA_SEK_038]|uniref:septation ring formation regulator EzrA n=1 Tax=Bacillus sp. DTU_2020_1000418_1_SI_GHA_SEK_038 TaxID=3077585 RepID=UPI0028EFF03C|nr:septation ring formation regulator EzrA [Bacillus sp. DTU_2020_1000418_1_SI_GHA_SEK_038]WNS74608.1 septation ring formation regulator EzrA [Bacillus sp. DTU_2020_1000418_1_SI_GHA_SEK_038]